MASMFERYGGFANISKVVMAFYDKAIDSDVIGEYFEDVDLKALIDHQTKFIAQVMDGPVSYTNEMLQGVHAKHNIDKAAFDEMAALLKETLEDFDIDPADIEVILDDVMSRSSYIIGA